MGNHWTLTAKKEANPAPQMDKAPNSRVECSISWRMAAIGETCPQTCHRTRAVFWHYKNWRSEGVLDEIMTALHAQVRQRAQKNSNGHDCWSLTSVAVKNTCTASIETKGWKLLQIYQRERVLGQIICPKISHHQTPSGSRYIRIAIFQALYERECQRWPRRELRCSSTI